MAEGYARPRYLNTAPDTTPRKLSKEEIAKLYGPAQSGTTDKPVIPPKVHVNIGSSPTPCAKPSARRESSKSATTTDDSVFEPETDEPDEDAALFPDTEHGELEDSPHNDMHVAASPAAPAVAVPAPQVLSTPALAAMPRPPVRTVRANSEDEVVAKKKAPKAERAEQQTPVNDDVAWEEVTSFAIEFDALVRQFMKKLMRLGERTTFEKLDDAFRKNARRKKIILRRLRALRATLDILSEVIERKW